MVGALSETGLAIASQGGADGQKKEKTESHQRQPTCCTPVLGRHGEWKILPEAGIARQTLLQEVREKE